jgi:SAM-dependent methyltransferase
MVSEFERLVAEAERAPIGTWDFSWFDGRAVEERPSWRYFDRVVEHASSVSTLLEIQAGVGTLIASLPSPPPLAIATEGYAPSVALAEPRLRSVGAHLVVTAQDRPGLPFADQSFELVISRHPVDVWWTEIYRVLRPAGSYFAQHVGPHSLRSLSEFLMGPLPDASARDVAVERRAAQNAGLIVQRMTLERPRVAFFDVGAVVYFLRLVPWIVPDFTVSKYRQRLRELHDLIQVEGAFDTTSSRVLVRATRPAT